MYPLQIAENSYCTQDARNIVQQEDMNILDKKRFKKTYTIQTHIDPVPDRIMKQIITVLGIGRDEFRDILRKI